MMIIIIIIISVLYIKYSLRECATVVDVLSTVLMVFGVGIVNQHA